MSDFSNSDIRRLDGGLLLVFRELLRQQRVVDAADTLGLSPSAVSHALARLRDLFDDPLFIRRPHGLEPTRAALQLGPKIESLIQLAGATLARDRGFEPSRSDRRFNLAAPEFVTALIGARLIRLLNKEAPHVSFAVGHQPQEPVMDALRKGEIDLAVGRFGALRPGLSAEDLYSDEYCAVARRGHPKFKGRISLKDYCDAGIVFAHWESEVAGDTALPGENQVKMAAAVPNWLSALLMVAASDSIAACPRRLAERQAKLLGLQVMKMPMKSQPFTVRAVRRTGDADAGVDWFLDKIRQSVS
jgi:DNA-binding transcriptional LysR family regulator